MPSVAMDPYDVNSAVAAAQGAKDKDAR